MLKKISENIWKIYFKKFGSNVYLLNKKILIDTSSAENKNELLKNLKKLNVKPENIKKILLTHTHYDHIGNVNSFKNAEIYTSREENFEKAKTFNKFKLKSLRIINTPGHSPGSVCFFLERGKILFSGDTLFENGFGRIDLPESRPEEMKKSLEKLKKLRYKILCAGH